MIRAVASKLGLNWRSWWADGPEGPIPQAWQVTSWPTIFVIDAQGVLRYRLGSAENLEPIVEGLLHEVQERRRS
jgi:hypothetical protein